LRENELDLVFLDIRLRGGSGLDLLPYIDYRKTALIFVTAHEELLDKAKGFPVADTLFKPVDEGALSRALSRVLRRMPRP
jgi:two-component SAPR family response regulator